MTLIVQELQKALLTAGVPAEQADAAAKAVLERQEAFDRLVTKQDLYRALLIQAGVIIGAVAGLLKLFP
jgi:hypothetical protein